ncbi:alpha/beta hydrolase [Mesorhizobium sp. WSM3859]|uniref:alpha/beta fold hydrolase n=1 Tax=Mesorhizobium sp. WSM3859 TaxID=2029402 RepID=UPI000BB05D47|nr:alpha/beta hydrolase [Mesorhizobium sp. WSM3859]PBC11735.1 alpha/beta hydrolase [Mesorhizobium sp. WSM3859]
MAWPAGAVAQTEQPISIVLVHGAFVDGSGWKPVYDILTKDGYEVLIVQNPTRTLEDDVATTARVIASAKHPVVLVGHSYGGAVISEAGDDPKVRSLVYLAAFAPDKGESVLELAEKPTPGEPSAPLLPPADGYLLVDPAKFPTAFAADVDLSTTRFMAAAQMPWGLQAPQAKLAKAAWKGKPTYYLLTTQDHMIPPSTQRMMAKRTGGKLVEIGSSHAVMLSHPQDVASFIESAASASR